MPREMDGPNIIVTRGQKLSNRINEDKEVITHSEIAIQIYAHSLLEFTTAFGSFVSSLIFFDCRNIPYCSTELNDTIVLIEDMLREHLSLFVQWYIHQYKDPDWCSAVGQ